jgi:hypothetical protein
MMGLNQYSTLGLEVGPLVGGLSPLVLELPWLTPTCSSYFASKSKWVSTKGIKKWIDTERERERERERIQCEKRERVTAHWWCKAERES